MILHLARTGVFLVGDEFVNGISLRLRVVRPMDRQESTHNAPRIKRSTSFGIIITPVGDTGQTAYGGAECETGTQVVSGPEKGDPEKCQEPELGVGDEVGPPRIPADRVMGGAGRVVSSIAETEAGGSRRTGHRSDQGVPARRCPPVRSGECPMTPTGWGRNPYLLDNCQHRWGWGVRATFSQGSPGAPGYVFSDTAPQGHQRFAEGVSPRSALTQENPAPAG
jgi:hypothetical protein